MLTEVQKAVRLAGSPTRLAAVAYVSERAVQHWLANGRVPATPARLIELELDGVSAARLRKPDRQPKES